MANTKIPSELSSTPSISDGGNATAITIDSSENVIIGNSNALGLLTIKAPSSDDQDLITISEDGTNQAFSINSNFAGAGSTNNNITLDSYWTNDIITFRGDGNVGIGTASPVDMLTLAGTTKLLTFDTAADASFSGIRWSKNLAGGDSTAASITSTNEGNYGRKGIAFSTGNNQDFTTDAIERMRIDSSGNVGINESSPDFSGFGSNGGGLELDDVGANFTAIRVSHGATGDFYMAANTGAAYLWGKANSPIVIGTNNTEKMRILEDGDLRLGTSSIVFSSGEKMSILHNGGHGLGIKTSGDVSYQPLALFNNTIGTAVVARFEVGYGPAGAISSNATTTTYGQPSDYRLKENIVPLPSATAKVNALNPVRFNMIANPENTTVDGFIAHEVQEIVPEAVVHQKDAIDEDGNPEYQQMDASKLIPIMVKTIQELEARITTLESS